ncbi:MAG TPA: DUF4928 family protein [Desulfosporosinus sp.]|nr:DUF4928 family protein [Desulfosporosinus sp.]
MASSRSHQFNDVESFWAEQVRDYFNNLPFTLTADPSRTIGASLDELFEQAKKRQKENPGTQYLGTMLQHLVAAKLSLILPPGKFEIHDASVADSPTDRSGDFAISNTILHCTTAPGEPLIQKCKMNIHASCLPVIITIFNRVRTAQQIPACGSNLKRSSVSESKVMRPYTINIAGITIGAQTIRGLMIEPLDVF